MIKTLIHIGLYKTGSSFLADWFDKNPFIHAKSRTIAGFRSTFELINFAKSADFNNVEYFALYDAGFTSLSFENFNKDAIADFDKNRYNSLRILNDLINQPKILLILRNKNDFIKSAYSQYIKEGGIHLPHKMIEYYKEYLVHFFNYDKLIEDCYSIFGKENIKLLPFELLEKDASRFISEIETFLNITHYDYRPVKINKSLSNNQLYWQFQISSFTFKFFNIFGKTGKSFYYAYQKCLRKKAEQDKIPFLTIIFSNLFKNKSLSINFEIQKEIIITFNNINNIESFSDYKSYYE